jgi:hypothetical protein
MFQFVPNAAGSDAKGIQRKPMHLGKLGTAIDFLALVALIILEDQLLVGGWELRKTPAQGAEPALVRLTGRLGVWPEGSAGHAFEARGVVKLRIFLARAANIFEKNEAREHVAILRRRDILNMTHFGELARNAIQRLVGEFISIETAAAIEVLHEAPANFEVTVAVGAHTFV